VCSYFPHYNHLQRTVTGIQSTRRFNEESKNKQTNKEGKEASFPQYTTVSVSAAKTSLLRESTPVWNVNIPQCRSQLLRRLSSITVIKIIRNHWLNTQRPDSTETSCHQGLLKTMLVYPACMEPHRSGNPHNLLVFRSSYSFLDILYPCTSPTCRCSHQEHNNHHLVLLLPPPPPPWLHYPKRISASLVALLHPPLSCATCLQSTIPAA
jgi:hypothetical protein